MYSAPHLYVGVPVCPRCNSVCKQIGQTADSSKDSFSAVCWTVLVSGLGRSFCSLLDVGFLAEFAGVRVLWLVLWLLL